jgi:hypothetical protein
MTFIDAGGHHSKEVNSYCRTRQRQQVFAIIGSTLEGAPLVGNPTRNNSARTIQYKVGSFAGKESLATRLARVTIGGPGLRASAGESRCGASRTVHAAAVVTPTNRGGRKWHEAETVLGREGARRAVPPVRLRAGGVASPRSEDSAAARNDREIAPRATPMLAGSGENAPISTGRRMHSSGIE